ESARRPPVGLRYNNLREILAQRRKHSAGLSVGARVENLGKVAAAGDARDKHAQPLAFPDLIADPRQAKNEDTLDSGSLKEVFDLLCLPAGHVPVPDARACGDSTGAVSDAWRQASARALGRSAESLHAADGTTRDRSDPAVQNRQGCLYDRGDQLGRSVGDHAARRRARPETERGAPDHLPGGG